MRSEFNQLKVQGKLFVILGSIAFIGVLITGWTIIAVNNLDTLAANLYQTGSELSTAFQAKNMLKEMELSELSYVLSQDPAFLHENVHHSTQVDLFIRNALIRSEKSIIQAVLTEIQREKAGYDDDLLAIEEAGHAEEWHEAQAIGLETAGHVENMVSSVDRIIQQERPFLEQEVARSNQQLRISMIIGASSLLIFLILTLVAAGMISRQVTSPIQTLTEAAAAVESGQFDRQSLESLTQQTDEVGQLARAFVHTAEEIDARREQLKNEIAQIRQKLQRT